MNKRYRCGWCDPRKDPSEWTSKDPAEIARWKAFLKKVTKPPDTYIGGGFDPAGLYRAEPPE